MSEHWVVVGAGSAGCVAAARLSEHGARHVTLFDDGPDLVAGSVPPAIDGPNFIAALAEPGRTHERLVATRTTGSEPTTYQRGKGVGGSSAVNAMIGLRGETAQYERWGWIDTNEMWDRVAIPVERPDHSELGPVDRALLQAHPAADVAMLTRRNGRRVTSAEAYLWPALDRPNLDVRPNSSVDVVTFDGRRATGVRLTDGSTVAADHVVMAAGAIHSPAILLRSGVNTRGLGHGLQDHPSAPLTLQFCDGVQQDRSGLVIGSLLQHEDIQVLPMNHLGTDDGVRGLGLLMVALMTPVGRAGRVTSARDGDEPTVDFAMLSDDRDVRALTIGVRLAMKILQHAAFAAIVEEVYIDAFGSTLADLSDDASIGTWLRSNCGDYVHATSTCAMGIVVDDCGAVHGYEQLSVCDASVFPSIPNVNTHLPATMLAERLCARWVLGGTDRPDRMSG